LAVRIFNEDVELCEKMAANGATLINDGDQILTHCNTGGLATAGVGTALGVIRKAHEQGKKIHVYVDETRPLLQGGRLTAWELSKLNIPCTLITDNMAAHLMSLKKINKAIVGSDRIAVNGDFANKIGTYSVAVNCHYHQIPFYVAAPYTTVDPECANGSQIPIEQRNKKEVQGYGELLWAPHEVAVYNPSFDVTPHKLVSAWILDKKVYYQKDVDQGVFRL
ncbi:MAG: S-methyl-5-thioribose-1-phosphate isomerase, partial [Pseudobdellovibrio sp.]